MLAIQAWGTKFDPQHAHFKKFQTWQCALACVMKHHQEDPWLVGLADPVNPRSKSTVSRKQGPQFLRNTTKTAFWSPCPHEHLNVCLYTQVPWHACKCTFLIVFEIFISCMGVVLRACISVHCRNAVPAEARSGCQVPWVWITDDWWIVSH